MAIHYKCISRDVGFSYYMGQNQVNSRKSFVEEYASTKRTRQLWEEAGLSPNMPQNVCWIDNKTGKIEWAEGVHLTQKVRATIENYAKV